MVPELWCKPLWEKVWPCLGPWDSVRLRTASICWNVPGKYGPHGELFSLFIQKKQVVASKEVLPNPCVSARTLEACALSGLHLLAADYGIGSSGCQSLFLGDLLKYGCPQSPIWSSPCSASVTSGDDEEFLGTTTSARPLKSLGRIGSNEVEALYLVD